MLNRNTIALQMIVYSLFLGALADQVIRNTLVGLGTFLIVIFGINAFLLISYASGKLNFETNDWILVGAALFFGSAFVWRDSSLLLFLDAMAIFTIMIVQVIRNYDIKPWVAGTATYFVAGIATGFNLMFGPLVVLIGDIQWSTESGKGARVNSLSVIKGLLIAIPIIFLLGSLLASADGSFETFVGGFMNFDIAPLIQHTLVTLIFAWLICGYLRASIYANSSLIQKFTNRKTTLNLNSNNTPAIDSDGEISQSNTEKIIDLGNFQNTDIPRVFTLGAIETYIILGGINLLFLIFVIFQLPYLFGGIDLVQSTPNFTLSNYARRGFGELVTVAIIVLPMLLMADWLIRKDRTINVRLFRVLAFSMIALLFVMLASAAQRLILISGNLGYGMTDNRLYSLFFVAFLGLVSFWFLVTVLRGNRKSFAWGALLSGLLVLASLNLLNPEDYVVRKNFELAKEGRPIDVRDFRYPYNDAIPALIDALPSQNKQNREVINEILAIKACDLNKYYVKDKFEPFLGYNYSRERARKLLSEKLAPPEANCVHSFYFP